MGRSAQGPKVRWRPNRSGGYWQVYFTLDGERIFEDTGITDQRARRAAEGRGREIYADAVKRGTRRRQSRVVVQATGPGELSEWLDAWLEEHPIRGTTLVTYEKYAGYWTGEFGTLSALTDVRIAQYTRKRLKKVIGKTVRSELAALRRFLEWAVEAGALVEAPHVPTIKASVGGKRHTQRHRVSAPELSPDEVEALLEALPEYSTREGWPIRSRFVFAYETSLRPATLDRLRAPENFSPGSDLVLLTEDDDKELYGREVPLTVRAQEAIESVCPKEGEIFGRHRYDPYIQEAAKKLIKAKVLDKRRGSILCGQHVRSAAITRMLELSSNMAGVQLLAGHKHASTTSKYVRRSLRAAREVVAARDAARGVAPDSVPRPR